MSNSNNNHEVRTKVKELFTNELKLSDLEASDLEIGIFNYTLDYANSYKLSLSWTSQLFMDTYVNISRSIYSNLKKDSYINNRHLLDKLKNREFIPHKLPYMSCDETFPEKWINIIEKQKLKFKAAYEIKQVAMIDTIKCGKCKKNKISYYELQTRSGDEAMTCYFNCLVCGHKWKN